MKMFLILILALALFACSNKTKEPMQEPLQEDVLSHETPGALQAIQASIESGNADLGVLSKLAMYLPMMKNADSGFLLIARDSTEKTHAMPLNEWTSKAMWHWKFYMPADGNPKPVTIIRELEMYSYFRDDPYWFLKPQKTDVISRLPWQRYIRPGMFDVVNGDTFKMDVHASWQDPAEVRP